MKSLTAIQDKSALVCLIESDVQFMTSLKFLSDPQSAFGMTALVTRTAYRKT